MCHSSWLPAPFDRRHRRCHLRARFFLCCARQTARGKKTIFCLAKGLQPLRVALILQKARALAFAFRAAAVAVRVVQYDNRRSPPSRSPQVRLVAADAAAAAAAAAVAQRYSSSRRPGQTDCNARARALRSRRRLVWRWNRWRAGGDGEQAAMAVAAAAVVVAAAGGGGGGGGGGGALSDRNARLIARRPPPLRCLFAAYGRQQRRRSGARAARR